MYCVKNIITIILYLIVFYNNIANSSSNVVADVIFVFDKLLLLYKI